MPVERGKDASGPFYRWGPTGKPYRYAPGDRADRERARSLAERQGRAVRASQKRRMSR